MTKRYDPAMTRPRPGPRGEGWVVLQTVLLAVLGVAGLLGLAGAGGLGRHGPARLGLRRPRSGLDGLLGANQVAGIRDLGANLTPLPTRPPAPSRRDRHLRKVRHPIYGGIVLGGSAGLLDGLTGGAGLAAILVPFFWLKSSIEERWLEQRFADYDAYRSRTRRFIAWLG